jgi:hypothetical protein
MQWLGLCARPSARYRGSPVTAVVACSIDDVPVLVGDVVLTYEGERVSYAGKVYRVGLNVAIGWSGAAALARVAIGRLLGAFGEEHWVTETELRGAFDSLSDLRGASQSLELIGWFVPGSGPYVAIRWASRYSPTLLSRSEGAIGDGGEVLRQMMAPPLVGAGNTEGHDTVPTKAANGFIEARFEEMLRAEWPRTWGAAFDLLVYQEGVLPRGGELHVDRRFRWMPSLTYVGWDISIDDEVHIVGAVQAAAVYKQERVHPCTVMYGKILGQPDHVVKVSTPIDRDIEESWYARRPFSAVSDYMANYFRIFRNGRFLVTMPTVIGRPTRNGLAYHDSDDPEEPRFAMTARVEPLLREVLENARAGGPSYSRIPLGAHEAAKE